MFSFHSIGLAFCNIALATCAVIAAPVELIPPELSGAIQPQVAVAPGGRIHVASGKGEAIYYVGSSNKGQTFSKPVQVGELPKLALGLRRGPRIAATDKVIAISAISHGDGDLHVWTSGDNGATWTEHARINDVSKSAAEGLHAMAGDGKSFVATTWLDHRNGTKEVWAATSHDGGSTWSSNVAVYKSPDGHVCECCHPGVALDAHGRIAVMFRNWLGGSRDMYLATSVDGGKTFGVAQKLGTGTWKLNGCPMDGGALAFDDTGKLFTTWRREKTIFATGAGDKEEKLADSALQPIAVAIKNRAYFLWESGGGLMLQKSGSAPTRFAEKAMFAAAAPLPDRGAIVVWQSETNERKTLLGEILD
jgi:BNR repeat-like domain